MLLMYRKILVLVIEQCLYTPTHNFRAGLLAMVRLRTLVTSVQILDDSLHFIVLLPRFLPNFQYLHYEIESGEELGNEAVYTGMCFNQFKSNSQLSRLQNAPI